MRRLALLIASFFQRPKCTYLLGMKSCVSSPRPASKVTERQCHFYSGCVNAPWVKSGRCTDWLWTEAYSSLLLNFKKFRDTFKTTSEPLCYHFNAKTPSRTTPAWAPTQPFNYLLFKLAITSNPTPLASSFFLFASVSLLILNSWLCSLALCIQHWRTYVVSLFKSNDPQDSWLLFLQLLHNWALDPGSPEETLWAVLTKLSTHSGVWDVGDITDYSLKMHTKHKVANDHLRLEHTIGTSKLKA